MPRSKEQAHEEAIAPAQKVDEEARTQAQKVYQEQ